MNFDGLDDQLDIGYTPSINTKSRSAGMKKPTRKAQTKPPPVNTTKKQDDFDLLDQLLASPVKNKPSDKPKNNNVAKNNNDDVQSFFDEPSLPINNKNTQKIQKVDTSSTNRPATAKTVLNLAPIQDTIVQQIDTRPNTSFKFKRPQTAVNIPVKPAVQEQQQITISPSLRMMKPPLRKRDSKQEKKQQAPKSTGGMGLGLTLTEQPPKRLSNQVEDENKFKPSLSSKRRSSIEMSNQQLILDNQDKSNIQHQNKNTSINIASSISIANNNQPKSNLFSSFGTQKNREYKNENLQLRLQIKPQPKPQFKKSSWQSDKGSYQQQFTNFRQDNQINQNKKISTVSISNQQFQKQFQFVKRNYQKHIDSLQKNLEQQIKTNKDSRDRLMRETNNMIENQRNRMKKIHEEQLDRVKQMSEWQKKKIQENYKAQIQSLKTQLNLQNQSLQRPKNNTFNNILYSQRKQIQYLEEKLRSERRLLQQKSRLLDKRQADIEQREQQFNKNKRLEQERLRNQERRIFQYEMDSKKQLLNEKRLIQDQKQTIATEMATLQMGNYKKCQKIQLTAAQLERQKRQLERQRLQMRKLNNQMMHDYQRKTEQLNSQRERLTKMQSELIGKIKVVQAHATRQRANTSNPTHKQNTWINNTTIVNNQNGRADEAIKKSMSVQKQAHQKKLQKTQNKFIELVTNVKDNLQIGKKGKQFDLDNYLMSMAHYTRQQFH